MLRGVASTPLSAAAGTNPANIGFTPTWVKVGVAIPYTSFQTAATTNSIALFTLAIAGVIHAVKIKHSTAFSGAAITAVTMSVGISGTNDKYASAFDVFQAVSNTAFEMSSSGYAENHGATAAITVTSISTGANLTALSAGAVDIWALLSVAL